MSKDKQNDCNYVTIEDVLDIDKAKSIGQMIAEEVDKQISKDIAEVLKKRLPTFYKVDEEKVMRFAKAFLKAENGKPGKSEGEWIDLYKGKYANQLYACSVCEKGTLLRPHINNLGNMDMVQALSPYCPNCGAKMKGGE